MKYLIFFVVILVNSAQFLKSQIVINEICPVNSSSAYDEEMDSPDWIELYNSGETAANLKDYRISDSEDYDNAWIFPDTLIKPGEYIVIFASGEDRVRQENFVIESSGEGIAIFNKYEGMTYLYIPIEGDFDMSVDMKAMRNFNRESRIALMLREELDEFSRYASIVSLNPDNGEQRLLFKEQTNIWGNQKFIYNKLIDYPWGRIRIKREDDSVFVYTWFERADWFNDKHSCFLPLTGNKGYVGIAVASSDQSQTTNFVLSNLILNGQNFDFSELQSYEVNCGSEGKFYYSREFHTDFKLSKSGDSLYLWDNQAELVQSIATPKLRVDMSYGSFPNGSNIRKYFKYTTPGNENSNPFEGIADTPEPSFKAGFYSGQTSVRLLAEPISEVYYSIDGSEPDENAIHYQGELITIDTSTVIRAVAYRDGYIESALMNDSYFIDDSTTLPIISFITESEDLWDEDDGIFQEKNRNNNMEIPSHFEYWDENRQLVCESGAGAKLHGQHSRKFPQKSIRVFAKSKYNATTFDYPFFDDYGLDKYERLVFRNGGTDWKKTIFRDGYAAWLSKQSPHLDAMGFKPAVMFMNGVFYGIQNVRERLDERYVSMKYDIPVDSINLLEDWEVVMYGSMAPWTRLKDSIMNYDWSREDSYDFIDRNIDIKNLTDFVIFEMVAANIDWPWKNMKWWQSKDYDGKWRWILQDLDYIISIGSFPDLDMYPMVTDSTQKFSMWFPELFKNEKFKIDFINRTADLTNTIFLKENTYQLLDSVADIFRPEVPRQNATYPESLAEFEQKIEDMKDFLNRRPKKHLWHTAQYFGLGDTGRVYLHVEPGGAGKIKISTITPDEYPWEGKYITDVPVVVEAIPNKGYEFDQWTDDINRKQTDTIYLESLNNLVAEFKKNGDAANIIINEIMYTNHDVCDSKDWIELYNTGENEVDLSNWMLKDDNDEHIYELPENTILDANGYLVVCRDSTKFKEYYPEVFNIIGNFDFGFGKEDEVRIFTADGILHDSVSYTNKPPWYEDTDGTGKSLELKKPESSRVNAANWQSSYKLYGTPGEKNSTLVDSNKPSEIIYTFKVFPNPVKTKAYVEINLEEENSVNLNLYDLMGNKHIIAVNVSVDRKLLLSFDVTKYAIGTYYLELEFLDNTENQYLPLIIIKE